MRRAELRRVRCGVRRARTATQRTEVFDGANRSLGIVSTSRGSRKSCCRVVIGRVACAAGNFPAVDA